MLSEHNHKIFGLNNKEFDTAALSVFRRQAEENPVYHDFLNALQKDPATVRQLTDIPYLPIRFFKSHQVTSGLFEPQMIFESSGTTGSINSRHFVKDISLYRESFVNGFTHFYGDIKDWCIIGLLPSYLERGHSSLVFMVDELIRLSGNDSSGFYLHDLSALATVLNELEKKGQQTLLIGVTYALLDFAEQFPIRLQHTLIMETGGMKGRREEMIRAAVHEQLKKAFGTGVVHSEYGMTELLSQAYSKGEGIFNCPPWMKVLLRDEEDPFTVTRSGSGTLNIIDLANQHSCSFIATDDAGRLCPDGSFEVLGRIDGSDLRGCSLLVL